MREGEDRLSVRRRLAWQKGVQVEKRNKALRVNTRLEVQKGGLRRLKNDSMRWFLLQKRSYVPIFSILRSAGAGKGRVKIGGQMVNLFEGRRQVAKMELPLLLLLAAVG